MKIRVCFTTVFDDKLREALGQHFNLGRKANRDEIRKWLISNATAFNLDILDDYERNEGVSDE